MDQEKPLNFIEQEIENDIANKRYNKHIHTRFPPEPNGYLHIGHATAICFNFGIAQKYNGKTNLRFDDTNPTTEKTLFVESIKEDIKWLGFQWDGEALYASDYFDTLYEYAITLIKKGLAFVDDSSAEEIAVQKGTPTEPGTDSPFKTRTIEENLELFVGMKEGKFDDGSKVLRVKVDMSSPNMHMRDPVIYRIKKETHHRTGDKWCIYPMYDFAHGQSDSVENITHSLCSLEFKHHRPLYNWFIEQLEIFPSRQIEFARRNISYMITSKRKLKKLVEENVVTGWDDPRMSTISGLRRRGYPAEAIRNFCDEVGMAKRDNVIEIELLESFVRDVLNRTANRIMVVEDPLKLVITNYPEGQHETMMPDNNPEDENAGKHELPFGRNLFIDREDFMVDPPKKYFRLAPGKTVRLKNGYIVEYEDHDTDADGQVTEVRVKYFDNTKSGEDNSGIKAKGVLHWVPAEHAVKVNLYNYDKLYTDPTPASHDGKDILDFINPDSLLINDKALAEPYIKTAQEMDNFQLFRKGYYVVDRESNEDVITLNKTVEMKSSWKKPK